EIVTSDKQVAGETAAVFKRIASGLGKLERLALAFRHLRCVDNGSYRLFGLCTGFLSDLFFRCFEWRFHINRLSFRAKSRNPAEQCWVTQRDVSTSLDMTEMRVRAAVTPHKISSHRAHVSSKFHTE